MDNFELNRKHIIKLLHILSKIGAVKYQTCCFNSDVSVLVSLKSNTRAEQIVNKGHHIFHLKQAEKTSDTV